MKIVIVDDDILVSSALKTILEAGGEVEVTGTGQDGKDAVRLYDELLPDVLLMDIRMKDMNGLDAAEQILKGIRMQRFFCLPRFLMMSTS